MAGTRKSKLIRVRVVRSFEGLVMGDEFETLYTDRVQGLVRGAFLKVVAGGGESTSGPGPVDAGDPGGEPEGAAPESSASAEPGEDPRAG